MQEDETLSLRRYFSIFVGAYIGLTIFLAMIVLIFKIDRFNAANIIITIGSAMFVVERFIKREARPPNVGERKKLILGSFLLMGLIELCFGSIVIFGGGAATELATLKGSGHIGMIAIIFTIVLAIYMLIDYLLLRWIYGSQARRMYDRMQEKQARKKD